ncbi:MAG: thiolase family protein [Deltaproteobacteria bacterium]|nr:thiolase family protein [Deltaproteobacteria bacterium]
MAFKNAYIPYGAYWSSPYARWQGSFANLHSIELAGQTGRKFFELRKISPEKLENLYLGLTIAQPSCFYGGPWIAGLLGMGHATGPVVGQACITGIMCMRMAGEDLDNGFSTATLVVATDRCSNGPHLYYPRQDKPGATGDHEDWVWDNFGHDPWAKNSMIQTADNVAKEHGITRAEMEEAALRRCEQYADALKDDAAFLRRFMVPVEIGKGKRAKTIAVDEGITTASVEMFAGQKPVIEGGATTPGMQTHPADGNSGMIMTTKERAAEYSQDKKITVQLIGVGTSRVKKGFMGAAMVPAAERALADAGIKVKDLKGLKTHNPFTVNDVLVAKKLGYPQKDINNYGCSYVWGHPQGPTALRSVIELVEELVIKGGGLGMFTGCAAGDTGGAVVVKVTG